MGVKKTLFSNKKLHNSILHKMIRYGLKNLPKKIGGLNAANGHGLSL